MIVRLQHLSARPPQETDLEAVTALMIVGDLARSGMSDCTVEDVRELWQTPGFNLKTDAWVITACKGQIVGYADVRQGCDGLFSSSTLVHPDYQSRGIGTLLVWLVEERARQLALVTRQELQVTIKNSISNLDTSTRQLLEHEGYTCSRSYWRIVIEAEDTLCQPDHQQRLKIDLAVNPYTGQGTARPQRRTGLYTTHQFDVYQKQLRLSTELIPAREGVGV